MTQSSLGTRTHDPIISLISALHSLAQRAIDCRHQQQVSLGQVQARILHDAAQEELRGLDEVIVGRGCRPKPAWQPQQQQQQVLERIVQCHAGDSCCSSSNDQKLIGQGGQVLSRVRKPVRFAGHPVLLRVRGQAALLLGSGSVE